MDNLGFLLVRFHLGGEFVRLGNTIDFVGGDEAWSYIEREKVSICEIVGNLKRHMIITDKDLVFLHWLFPGKELVNGLRPLKDDKECSYMSKCTIDSGVADVYAEVVHENSEEEDESDSEYELEEEEESDSEGDDHAISVPIAILSPSKHLEGYKYFYRSSEYPENSRKVQPGSKKSQAEYNGDNSWDGEDSENSEDEEAMQYRRNAKE
ncbi:unnamed protein product [Urochloa decumbens]|uniref:PB1-like domain-containing protein n=1 Tax=Urochloa decumbens TaxID=240449 RepID=A0ABC8Z5C6_9POAL